MSEYKIFGKYNLQYFKKVNVKSTGLNKITLIVSICISKRISYMYVNVLDGLDLLFYFL